MRGPNGRAGRNGLSGRDGSVLIKCGSESGSDRYNVCSKEYHLADENSDTIYEPLSKFTMHNIVFHNDGGFTLPLVCW